jgi:diacylglycerol O-acyltransferase / wax synthase
MERLKGIESLYLHVETGSMPMHMSTLTIYDPGTAPGGAVAFTDIQRFFAERAYRSAIFRRRLARLPLGLARPYWIEDPGFDIEFHLRHIALPKPGGWRELCEQVARLHARPLDRSRPLWECYVIEELDRIAGLPKGSFALFLKAHYAALGGSLGTQLFAAIHELSPDSRASAPKRVRFFDRNPTYSDLALRSVVDVVRAPLGLARYVAAHAKPLLTFGGREAANLVGSLLRLGRRAEDAAEVAVEVPRTRFNGKVSPHRVVEGVRLELADVERIRDKVPGGTVNDVALAVISGALRKYLEGRLEAPAGSIVVEAPLASRSETRVFGTRSFADSAFMPVASDIDDPVDRLRHVVDETRHQNTHFQALLGRRLLIDAMEFVPEAVLGFLGEAGQSIRIGSRVAPIANTTIESVRGPDLPLYMAGARLVGYYGLSAVHDLAGLGHIVAYYDRAMTIGVTACRTMLPDPARYAECLRDAYAELGRAVGVFPALPRVTPPGIVPGKPRRGRRVRAARTDRGESRVVPDARVTAE